MGLMFVAATCERGAVGSVTLNGRPAKAEIVQVDNRVTVLGYDVYLNGDLIGRTKRLPVQRVRLLGKSSIQFTPFHSIYGEVRIVQKLDFNSASFDLYIAQQYAGSIQVLNT